MNIVPCVKAVAANEMPIPICPSTMEDLRTNVSEAPAPIQRSQSLPHAVAEAADRKNTRLPAFAISFAEKFRPRTR